MLSSSFHSTFWNQKKFLNRSNQIIFNLSYPKKKTNHLDWKKSKEKPHSCYILQFPTDHFPVKSCLLLLIHFEVRALDTPFQVLVFFLNHETISRSVKHWILLLLNENINIQGIYGFNNTKCFWSTRLSCIQRMRAFSLERGYFK